MGLSRVRCPQGTIHQMSSKCSFFESSPVRNLANKKIICLPSEKTSVDGLVWRLLDEAVEASPKNQFDSGSKLARCPSTLPNKPTVFRDPLHLYQGLQCKYQREGASACFRPTVSFQSVCVSNIDEYYPRSSSSSSSPHE